MGSGLVDLNLLDDEWPFEIDDQVSHLFKHPYLGVEDIEEVWTSDPLFYPARHRSILPDTGALVDGR